MMIINNSKELHIEKMRLLALKGNHEIEFKSKWDHLRKQLSPYQNFIKNNFISSASESRKASPLVKSAIQYGIPLLIDRLMLGKRGFFVKEIGTWLSGRLANKMVQDPPVETFHKIGELFSEIKRIPFLSTIMGRLIERQSKKI